LVECKWQTKQAESSQTDAFSKKISRSSKQTMGLFLSINGWSEGVLMLSPIVKTKFDQL